MGTTCSNSSLVHVVYLEQPRCGLPGLEGGQLIRVKKGIYGLPDAPRAWFETLKSALTKEMGFRQMTLDVAMFVYWRKDGSISAIMAVHVDDCIVATDGTPDSEELVNKLNSMSAVQGMGGNFSKIKQCVAVLVHKRCRILSLIHI